MGLVDSYEQTADGRCYSNVFLSTTTVGKIDEDNRHCPVPQDDAPHMNNQPLIRVLLNPPQGLGTGNNRYLNYSHLVRIRVVVDDIDGNLIAATSPSVADPGRVYVRIVRLDNELVIVKVNSDILDRVRAVNRAYSAGVCYNEDGSMLSEASSTSGGGGGGGGPGGAPGGAAGGAGADGYSLGRGASGPAVDAAGGGLNVMGGGESLAAGLLFDRAMAKYAEEQAAIDAGDTDEVCGFLMPVVSAGSFDTVCGGEVEGFEWGNNEEI
ncbi:hypothetical protein BDK51DRAFT_51015 [Blyttiomyces helicus]|uniref:Uncharacterized protein n=1 Tax=Blyttiomyces helicus TaxID=388810 RepID=A0A4P9WC66_9FUNG|nr:hypothetical protein BDK51DRAFT_51015 [Blyttiomyces helicus]|eukprot:RKO88788.1 hypothetical protein BDK51DRAFT_51015 [Blyttiomyces helicus]